MTLTLAQLRSLKRIQIEDTNRPVNLVFYKLGGLESLLLEHLLYRFENHSQPVRVFLMDNSSLTLREASTGAFVTSEVGRPMSAILGQRYSGFFPNITFLWGLSALGNTFADAITENNAIVFSFAHTTQGLDFLIGQDLLRTRLTEDAFLFRSGYLGDGVFKATMSIYRQGGSYGGTVIGETPTGGVLAQERYTANALVAQRIFTQVNEMISGGSVTIHTLMGSVLTERMAPQHFMGKLWEGFMSRYVYLLEGLNAESVTAALSEWFDTFYDVPENEAHVEASLARLNTPTQISAAKAQVSSKLYSLMHHRTTVTGVESEKMRVLSAILLKLTGDAAQQHFGDSYVRVLLTFLYFVKANVPLEEII